MSRENRYLTYDVDVGAIEVCQKSDRISESIDGENGDEPVLLDTMIDTCHASCPNEHHHMRAHPKSNAPRLPR